MNQNFDPNLKSTEATQAPAEQLFEIKEENVLAGTVGAFLFSLVGGILWFLIYQFGFIAGISGIIGVICAIKGYALFSKNESKRGIVISTVVALIVIIIAWYFCLSYDVYLAYIDWYANGEVDFTLTFFESVANAYIFLTDPSIAVSYLKDLGIGLLFCVIGTFGYVKATIRKAQNS